MSLSPPPPVDPARRPDFASSRCLVTGGLGFVGSNLVGALRSLGAEVVVVDALVPGHGGDRRNVSDDVAVLVAEIGDEQVADAVDGCDFVFNVAGQVSHTESMRDPLRDIHLNATSHAAFLETVRRVNLTARVVHTSTRQVYGRADRQPVDESHAARPVDVNGVAKLAGEQLHMVYAHAYDMAITSLRLTNVYGPRQRLTSNELGFLPVFIRTGLQGGDIRLFGDGSQRRDCLYVADVVDALLAATAPAAIGEMYNVGHHEDHSLLDVAEMIRAGSRHDVTITLVPWPAEHLRIDIGSFHTDGSKIRAELGWQAHIGLADGLRSTLEFYCEQPWYLLST
jgi:UDP-glucose 4-epimerase